jgi:hypothetical protein
MQNYMSCLSRYVLAQNCILSLSSLILKDTFESRVAERIKSSTKSRLIVYKLYCRVGLKLEMSIIMSSIQAEECLGTSRVQCITVRCWL